MKNKQLHSTNKRTIRSRIPVSITYNRYLPNITKNRNILQISPTLQKVFDKKPMITYNRNKDLGELTRSHTLQGRKVFIKTFESYQTNGTFKIFHKLNCKSSFVIYLMECTLCLIKYVGKAGKPFNIR